MITVNIREEDEFIKLGQALKKAGVVGSGVDAKMVILDGQVSVNGQTELQRGKKLHNGDVVTFQGETIQIVQSSCEIFEIMKIWIFTWMKEPIFFTETMHRGKPIFSKLLI